MTDTTPRWIYRFENFDRAFALLREAMDLLGSRTMSQLEREGLIQRFEFTWELAWKVLKDVLENEGIVLTTITPASVIKAAFAAGLIRDGDQWMKALDARNKMSHTYDRKVFDEIVAQISAHYFGLLDALHQSLTLRRKTALPDG